MLPMKQENLVKLLFELIKNSKRSDRDLAKILGISQPTVTRLRKVLEKEAITQYTNSESFLFRLRYFGFHFCSHKRTCPSSLGQRKGMG